MTKIIGDNAVLIITILVRVFDYRKQNPLASLNCKGFITEPSVVYRISGRDSKPTFT